uniref:Uncharacterized protein n=1 Tax=Oryza punctata TaxID=4537 RepID=A0A0E0JIC1_ORYPU
MVVAATRLLNGAWVGYVAIRWHRGIWMASTLDAMVEGNSEVKVLVHLPVLAMVTLSGVVLLLESVAIGALVKPTSRDFSM